jgi:hypothetical protein
MGASLPVWDYILERAMKSKFLLLLILSFFMVLSATDVTVRGYVDKDRVRVGENFRLIIEARGEKVGSVSVPSLPDMPFTVQGPSHSTSTQTSIVNLQMTTTRTQTLTYTLRANSEGTHRILPISVMIDGNQFLTRTIDIVVSAGATQNQHPQQPGATQQQQQRQTPQQTQQSPDTFLRATIDKSNVFRNEMVIVHYKLYTQSQIHNINMGSEPSFSGFWKEDLFQADRIQWQREVYDGRQYNTFLARSIALFPSREGSLTIPVLELTLDIVVPARSFWEFSSIRQLKVSSRPLTITVNPLPPLGETQNFIGAVGRFDVSSSISAHEVEAGASLTYRIILNGTGNFNQAGTPTLPTIRGVRFLPPEIEDNKNRSTTNFSGRRTFIYPVIFSESGTVEIPEMEVSWFDIASRSYRTQTLPPETIFVRPSTQQIVTIPGSQHNIQRSDRDIEHISTNLSTRNFRFFYQTFWFWLWVSILVLSLIGHHFYILDAIKQDADLLYRRNRRASGIMRKYMREASKHAKQNSVEFYNSAYMGITHFLTDKLNIPRGSVERLIIETLREKQVSENIITDLVQTFEKINFIKFSSATNSSVNIKDDLQSIDNLISGLMTELNNQRRKK